jgi:hypothetical protein
MPSLDDLASGVYTSPDPYSAAPQQFRGAVSGETKTLIPVSVLSPNTVSTQRFTRSTAGRAAQPPKFKKASLGPHETASMVSMLAPTDFFPPGKRDRPRAEKISDLFVGLVGGAAGEVMDLVALPRTFADLAEGYVPQHHINKLPTRAQIGARAEGLSRYMPLNPGAMQTLSAGPQTTGGEYASQIGGFAPYLGLGSIAALRRLAPWAMGAMGVSP